MRTIIEVKNIMACGCNNSILKGLSSVPGVFGARIEPQNGLILVDHTDETGSADLVGRLKAMGYEPRLAEESETQTNKTIKR